MRRLIRLFLAGWLVSSAAFASAGELFASPEPLAVQIRGSLSALARDTGEARRWHAAQLTHEGMDYRIRLRARGNFRRATCRFPPLMLDFRDTKKGVLEGTLFDGQNRLKLVNQCERPVRSATDLREEYLAYRIFNSLTDASFRVRLLAVTWDDSEDLGKAGVRRTAPAFLIESSGELARRLGAAGQLDRMPVGARLEPAHANLVAVFQYFIGNTDYSLQGRMRGRECCHNAKVFDVGGELLSVPYDFDYSGLVNADYAGANPIVNQTNVRQRRYLGACIERAILESSVSRLAPLQSQLATLAEESGLAGGQVRRVLRYLGGPLAQSPERLVARLERACRK